MIFPLYFYFILVYFSNFKKEFTLAYFFNMSHIPFNELKWVFTLNRSF